jgi:hypothetical protein
VIRMGLRTFACCEYCRSGGLNCSADNLLTLPLTHADVVDGFLEGRTASFADVAAACSIHALQTYESLSVFSENVSGAGSTLDRLYQGVLRRPQSGT